MCRGRPRVCPAGTPKQNTPVGAGLVPAQRKKRNIGKGRTYSSHLQDESIKIRRKKHGKKNLCTKKRWL